MVEQAIIQKVLIYATRGQELLVFSEPDFPHIPLQVPGGTVEPGEDTNTAARREFQEETGLEVSSPFLPVFQHLYTFDRGGQRHQHHRYYFHTQLSPDAPDTWDHFEMTAHDGADPILFRFSWVPIAQAKSSLGLGMADGLPYLPEIST